MQQRSVVAVTGGGGLIGRLLADGLGDGFDVRRLSHAAADVTDLDALVAAFGGADAVVHLAAASEVGSSWEAVLSTNVVGVYGVYEAAYRARVQRVVFASSNHAVGMYEWDEARFDAASGPTLLPVDVPYRPDSLYGASKAWGEVLGRYYVERKGLRVVCLRIGWVTDDDLPPTATADPGVDDEMVERRGTGMWLSHRDCVSLIRAALTADVDFATVYGVSDNAGRWFSLEEASERLGWQPLDGASETPR